MATLDAFLMKYVLDGADDAIKKNKEVKKTSDDVEKQQNKTEKTTLNLNETFKNLSNNGLKNFITKTVSAIAPMVLLGKAIQTTLRFSQEADELDFLSKKAGTTVENIQAIAKASGSSSQAIASVFENLQGELQGLRKGENSQLLTDMSVKYGISFVGEKGLRSSQEIFDNVAKKMGSLSTAGQVDLANMLGLDDNTTKLMMQGFDKYNKSIQEAKKLNPFDKKFIEDAKKFQATLKQISNQFYYIAGGIARILLPIFNVLTKVVSVFVGFILDHTEVIKSALLAITTILAGKMLFSIKTLIPTFLKLGSNIWGALAPLLPFIALFTGLFLLIQDFYGWINGEDSFLGKIFGDFDKVKDKLLKFFSNIKQWFKDLWQYVKDTFLEVFNIILKPFKTIKNLFKKDKTEDSNNDIIEKAKVLDNRLSTVRNNVNNQSTMNNQYNSRNSNFSVGKIEINTQDNPNAIANSVSNTFEDLGLTLNNGML